MKPILCAVLMLMGCGPGPDFTTSHGVDVYQGVRLRLTPEGAQAAELDAIWSVARAHGVDADQVAACLGDLVCQVEDAPFPCTGEGCEGRSVGEYQGGEGRIVISTEFDPRCLHAMYRHELTHAILDCLGRPDAGGHSDPVWTEDLNYRRACLASLDR